MINEYETLINNKRLIFLPKSDIDYMVALKEMKNSSIFLFDDSFDSNIDLVNRINESSIEKIYFVNFKDIYRKILPSLNKKIKKYEIFTTTVANFTNSFTLRNFYDVIEFYERKLINKIYTFDRSLFEILKKANYEIEMFEIEVPFDESKLEKDNDSKSIGILSKDYDPVHNFYNMLTAVSFIKGYEKIKIISKMNATKKFVEDFNVVVEYYNSVDEAMKNNYVNLYCNFTNTNPYIALKSMDMKIPCILGNTDMFDDNELLKKYLVLKSDDDVNEIVEKINMISGNEKIIFEQYKKWRKEHIGEKI